MSAGDERALEEGSACLPAGVLAVRAGHGANCSSVGSAIDLLFAGSLGAAAILVAVTAALAQRETSSVPPDAVPGPDLAPEPEPEPEPGGAVEQGPEEDDARAR